MRNIQKAQWIKSPFCAPDGAVVLSTSFASPNKPVKATLEISALGVYAAQLNGTRVGDFILAPGWTSAKRVQYQSYDVTEQIADENTLAVTLGKGWRFLAREPVAEPYLGYRDSALIAALELEYADGSRELLLSDDSWQAQQSPIIYNNIYNGETYDATWAAAETRRAVQVEHDTAMLTEQQGEMIREQERIPAKSIIKTPAGETVIDFGQNLTGYVECTVTGPKGKQCTIKHAEVLDNKGNFYTENYRAAKSELSLICNGETVTYKPLLTFYGFRYIRLIDWPQEAELAQFTAIAVHSDMRRTGYFTCGDAMLNQLFQNVIWGQKGNFLDVPTDCPQRDERLGWTGDAQVFCRTASYNFDVKRFFHKWLTDLRLDQNKDGSVPHVIPNVIGGGGSAAWSDAAVICPWQLYLSYGDTEILKQQFDSMKQWIAYMKANSRSYLWVKGKHFGDWLCLDGKRGLHGPTDKKLIASAHYYYSTSLFIKAGQLLGEDMREYELLRENIGAAFRARYMKHGRMKQQTQTACVLALYFGLSDNPAETAKQLAEIVQKVGHLTTGFVGSTYLLHALSDNGYADVAYHLLLRKEFPSWLYPITMGATTIWERWDSMKPDGTMQDAGMTSFNHYAYGAVGDWLYGVVCGINTDENKPGFAHTVFRPIPDPRLGYAKAKIETRHGEVASEWKYQDGAIQFCFTVPKGCTGTFLWNGEEIELGEGVHTFDN